MGRVVFLDPSLGVASGHHAVVARNYRSVLRERGREAVFAGHRGGSTEAPVFRHRLEDAFRVCRYAAPWMGDPLLVRGVRFANRMLSSGQRAALPDSTQMPPFSSEGFAHLFHRLAVDDALDATWRMLAPQADDDIVALGVDPAMLAALHGRREQFTAPNGPRLHLLFMYPESDFLGPATSPAYWRLAQDLSRAAVFHAEIAAHGEALTAALGVKVGAQMTPVRLMSLSAPPSGVFTISVLGAGRADKGFLALPQIASAIFARTPDVVLRIQSPPRSAGLVQATRALKAMANVTLLPSALSDEAYESELTAAHLLLLPYDKMRYAARGSGVLLDALIGGRPMICSAGTALASELSFGNGLCASSPAGFAAAIESARVRYSEMLHATQIEAARGIRALRAGSVLSALGGGP